VPASGPSRITETAGGARVPATRAPSVGLAGQADGRVIFGVGSGHYRFEVAR